MNLTELVNVLFPELIILVGIMLTILASTCPRGKKHCQGITTLVLALASLAVLKDIASFETKSLVFGSLMQDSLSMYLRFLIYGITALISLGSARYLAKAESPGEYYPILLSASLGAGLLTAANDFLVAFVALETLGLSAILLASYARKAQASNEAGIKYLITSAIATATFLLGISFIYGLTGFTNFNAIALRLYQINLLGLGSSPVLILIGVTLIAAIAFKLGAVPFHNWSPDVYTGAPTTTTLFLSVVSKIAALGFAVRLLGSVYNNELASIALAVIAAASIILGNYVGLVQMISRGSFKRLLAYSSIAQAGYMVIALAVFDQESLASMILYLSIYAIMNTLVFLALIYFETELGSDSIYDLAGIINKRPWMTIAASLGLINLAALPFVPAGFIAKFFLFSAAFSSNLVYGPWLALVGLIGSVIGLYYYLYLVKIMVVDSVSTAVLKLETPSTSAYPLVQISTYASLAILVLVGIFGMDGLRAIAANVVAGL